MPLKVYLVNYQEGSDPPWWFRCHAEDIDHAVEQTHNAYPGSKILEVFSECEAKEEDLIEKPTRGWLVQHQFDNEPTFIVNDRDELVATLVCDAAGGVFPIETTLKYAHMMAQALDMETAIVSLLKARHHQMITAAEWDALNRSLRAVVRAELVKEFKNGSTKETKAAEAV